jgi:hypothetical protein
LTFIASGSSKAYSWTHYLAVASNLFMSLLYWFATTASWGSSGSGAHKRACSEISAVLIVRAGVHSFLRISRQMAPVWEETLGCHNLVSNFIYNWLIAGNFTFGGLKG